MNKAVLIVGSMLFVLATPALIYPVEGRGPAVGITWSRTYVPGDVRTIDKTPEGGFIVAGYGGGALVMKLNSAGQLEWTRSYTPAGYSSGSTEATSIRNTFDRGYILSGASLSLSTDAWLLKLDHRGQVQWSRTYGGPEGQSFVSVEQTRDGGYIVAGNNNNVSRFASNGWVLKMNSEGDVEWQHAFATSEVSSVDETFDGGFVVAGTVAVDVGVNYRGAPWVFKLDSKGRMVWQKAYVFAPSPDYHRGHFVRQTSDGGYVMVGEQIIRTPVGTWLSSDMLVFRLSAEGNVRWQKSFGGGGFTQTYSVEAVSDGSMIIAGRFLRRSSGEGIIGPFLLKADSRGSIVWQRVYGEENDFLYQVRETKGGGLVAVGSMASAYPDTWVLKLDGRGDLRGCTLGFPSNGTIADTNATTTITTETPVATDLVITSTDVAVKISPSGTPQTLCPTHQTRKNSDSS